MDPRHSPGIYLLSDLPNVRVQSLKPWVEQMYGTQDLAPFQSFFCKAAALLAAEEEVVAIVDLDAVLMASPFSLMDTPVFNETGTYLFRDRRTKRERRDLWESYKRKLLELWKNINPEVADKPPPITLTESAPVKGYSFDYGESAVLVYDKVRNADAIRTLTRMLSPLNFALTSSSTYGDKEVRRLGLSTELSNLWA